MSESVSQLRPSVQEMLAHLKIDILQLFDTKRKMEKMANLSPVCHHREADEEKHNDIKLAPPESKPTDC